MEYGLVLRWALLYALLAAVAFPAVAAVFRDAHDDGAGFAVPVALAVVGLVGYWLGRLSFGLGTAVVAVLVLAGASALAYRRGVRPDWRALGETMLVFAVAFLFLVAVRAVDPAIVPGGGEKFLDFGLLNSLLRAETLPPQDPWFAGETVKYYYGGHMIAALLTELTATPPAYAYNLALAGFYATLVTAAYGLAGTISRARGASGRLGGALGAVFVGFASNLATPIRVAAHLFDAPWLARAFGVHVNRFGQPRTIAQSPDLFSYWDASGVIPGTINEFPLFAFLNGDLHAHMMSTPLLLLIAGLCYAYWQTPETELLRRRLLVFGAVPAVGGLLAVVNTWSFPSVGGLTVLTLALAESDPLTLLRGERERLTDGRLRGELGRIGAAVAVAGVVLALSVLVAVPFFAGMVLGTGSERTLGLLPERSSTGALLVVHGAFVAVAATYLVRRADRDGGGDPGPESVGTATALVGLVLATAVYGNVGVLFVIAPVLVLTWVLARTRESVGYEAVLFAGATGLVLIVEFLYVKEQAGPGRMNTVFKTYMQVWVMFGVAAGGVLAVTLSELLPDRPDDLSPASAVAPVLAAALVVSLSLYGGIALDNHFDRGRSDATLDGTAYVETVHGGEAAAIDWLDEREGQPTLVSAPGTSIYQWVNGPSSLTGVPTVAGWNHEVGYRGVAAYRERVEDVETIYTGSPGERARLLDEYDVQYVYVGPTERDRYGGPTGTVSFANVTGVSAEPVFEGGDVRIYAVDQSAYENESAA